MTTSSDSGKDHERPQHKIPAPLTHTRHGSQAWPCQPGTGRAGGAGGRQSYTVHISKTNKRHHKPGK